MNWLNNLSQSIRLINIGNDWIICLMVSRTEEVPRGMGQKRKSDEHEQFPVKVSVTEVVDDNDEMFENSMPIDNSPEFNPSTIINMNNQENWMMRNIDYLAHHLRAILKIG